MSAPFRLYSTLTRKVEPFVPVRPGHVGLYVCGMTVYDRAHVGHARAFVVFDAFVRYLRYRGWDVTFVRNFTDIDDKIIARAAETGEDAMALSARMIEAFHEDTDALGLARPDQEPKVSTSIGDIQSMIAGLIERGHAYEQDGSVLYAVTSFEAYGKLSGQKLDELRSPDEVSGKRHPADFALWKAAKPGEPAWESPWGPGRPGWHIECSAMSCGAIGDTLDIHGGGLDLVFPHHENEIAQSEAANGAKYANFWMHNGLLTMSGGEKMGKSLGNAINIQEALRQFPAEVLRLYYLQNHYRSPLPWDGDALSEALGMLSRLYEALENAQAMGGEEPAAQAAQSLGGDALEVLSLSKAFPARFLEALDEDFNTGKALGLVFELVRAVNRLSNHKKAKKRAGPVVAGALKAFAMVSDALGLMGQDVEAFVEEVKDKRLGAMGVAREEIERKLAERTEARTARDWARADAIRDELLGHHIIIMDRPDGVDWRIRV